MKTERGEAAMISNTKKSELLQRICETMLKRGIRHHEICAQLDIHQATLWRWKTGKAYPSLEALINMGLLCGISRSHLLDEIFSETALIEKGSADAQGKEQTCSGLAAV